VDRPAWRAAVVVSSDGYELLPALDYALTSAHDGAEVAVYFQGPAVRVLTHRFTPRLYGWRWMVARLTPGWRTPAPDVVRRLQIHGGRLYACAPSLTQSRVEAGDLAFSGVTVCEYADFREVMARSDVQLLS
jgi:predicted peroxiredoxin